MKKYAVSIVCLLLVFGQVAHAGERGEGRRAGFLKKLLERRMENAHNPAGSQESFHTKGAGRTIKETVNGRDFLVYVPPDLPKRGRVPLLIALHGGFGNAGHLQNYLGMDAFADKGGFIVAYLNGTQVAGALPAKFQGWNAGGCCGQPQQKGVDDIGYITAAIDVMKRKYRIDPRQVFGTGHSNGAMMSMRIMCETNLYQEAVVYSGTLQMDVEYCPQASGKRIMNIHGSQDTNLPIEGGHTKDGFNKRTNYKSQAYARELFESSGGVYDLLVLEGADHSPETLNAKLIETEGLTLPEKIVRELGLD